MLKRLVVAAALCFSACASWTPLPHAPRTLASTNLSEDLMRVVMTARAWRPVKIDVKETFAVFSYAYNGTLTTVTLPWGEISKIELLSNAGKEFDVDVLDEKGERLYRYLAPDQARAEEFVDVLTAIAKPKRQAPPAQAPVQM